MHKRFAAGLLAAAAVTMAAGVTLPANAVGRGANRNAKAYALKSGVLSAMSVARAGASPQHINIAWTPAASMPVAVEELGGGAGAGKSFYVPGGYKAFPHTLNNTVQAYSLTPNTWTNDTTNPIPTVPGLLAGQADSTACWDPVGKQLHIVNGVGYDSTGGSSSPSTSRTTRLRRTEAAGRPCRRRSSPRVTAGSDRMPDARSSAARCISTVATGSSSRRSPRE
jgi:hypothetical protein